MRLLGHFWNFLVFFALFGICDSCNRMVFDNEDINLPEVLFSHQDYVDEYKFFDAKYTNHNNNEYHSSGIFFQMIATTSPKFDICDSIIRNYMAFNKHLHNILYNIFIVPLKFIAASDAADFSKIASGDTPRNLPTQHCVILIVFSICLCIRKICNPPMARVDNNVIFIKLLNY